MEDRSRTRRLPDGTVLRVNFTGEQKPAKAKPAKSGTVTIGGQSFAVGDKLDAQRTITAVTDEKVQLEDASGLGTRHAKTRSWYKHSSPKLIAIKKRGDKEGR